MDSNDSYDNHNCVPLLSSKLTRKQFWENKLKNEKYWSNFAWATQKINGKWNRNERKISIGLILNKNEEDWKRYHGKIR